MFLYSAVVDRTKPRQYTTACFVLQNVLLCHVYAVQNVLVSLCHSTVRLPDIKFGLLFMHKNYNAYIIIYLLLTALGVYNNVLGIITSIS